MQKDLMYLFDKKTFKRSILGEVQSGFNMSMVLDGTKDSISIMVWGFQESEIEPYTILYHAHTETWWVVKHDKVETYAHENGKMYVHNLELLGAIELLNARDLIDCGFDNDRYTTYTFIKRLFALSTFEFNKASDNSEQQGGEDVNLYITPLYSDFFSKNVDFIKSFENYTLLSALREFLDQFNYACKLSFIVVQDNGEYYLESAVLELKEKTGDRNHVYDIDEFDDVRETKTMDENSYGSTVVSNAENVISARAKTFPSTGSVMLSSTQGVSNFNDNIDSAVIRLPSNVYKGNWLDLISNSGFLYIDMRHILPDIADERIVGERYDYNPTSSGSFDKLIEYLFPQFQDDDEFAIECKQLLLEQRDRLESELLKASTIRLLMETK